MKRQFIAFFAVLALVFTPATTVHASDTISPPSDITDRLGVDTYYEWKGEPFHFLTMEYAVKDDLVQIMIQNFHLSGHNVIAGYAAQDGTKLMRNDSITSYQADFVDLNHKRLINGHTYQIHHYNQDLTKEIETLTAVASNYSFNVKLKVSGEFTSYLLVEDLGNKSEVTMYRAYNPYSGEHFYTSNRNEFNYIVSLGWRNEGTGWIAPAKSNTPVYRLYNKYGGEHHYTSNETERNNLIKAGWRDEGIGWYSDDQKRTPLYREYNPYAFANNHNYTTSKAENDHLVSLGWKYEGIGWYGLRAK